MYATLMSIPVSRFYYGYLQRTDAARELSDAVIRSGESDEFFERRLVSVVKESFTAGARWQLHESCKLSPYISRFLEMVVLLGPDYPRDDFLRYAPSVPDAFPDPIDNAPF